MTRICTTQKQRRCLTEATVVRKNHSGGSTQNICDTTGLEAFNFFARNDSNWRQRLINHFRGSSQFDSKAGLMLARAEGAAERAVALFTRLCSTLFIVGYLPDDLSGRQVFQFFDVSALAAVIRLLYVIHHKHQDTYDKEKDLHGIAWSIPASFLLAFFIHPTLNRSLVFDTIYTAATVLDTFCMLPQLYMMMNQGGKVCSLLTKFVVLQFISRVCVLIFWLDSWEELADGYDCMALWNSEI